MAADVGARTGMSWSWAERIAEKKINPFLRCAEVELRESLVDQMNNALTASDVEVFQYLRAWKDSF